MVKDLTIPVAGTGIWTDICKQEIIHIFDLRLEQTNEEGIDFSLTMFSSSLDAFLKEMF